MKIKANQKNLLTLAKIIIAVVSIWYIYYTLTSKTALINDLEGALDVIIYSFNPGFIGLVMALVAVNWGLEALKWQFLASKMGHIGFGAALKGVLSGLTLGFITPHSIGDYAGRIYFLKIKDRLQAIGAVLLARISLFYITLFYGILGAVVLFRTVKFNTAFFNPFILFILVLLSASGLWLLVNFDLVQRFFGRFKTMKRILSYFNVLERYTFKEYLVVFLLSLARYLVFNLQYLILLYLVGINPFDVFIIVGVWLVFFTKSVFPAFNFLSDLGIREAAALYFLGNAGAEPVPVMVASLSLWVINILIPTIVGLFFVLSANNTVK